GVFAGRSEASDINFQYRILTEFNNNPRLVDVNYTDANGQSVVYSQGGIYNRIGQTSNRFLRQNKTALYLTDEIIAGKWRFDMGFRYEFTNGVFSNGGIASSTVYNDTSLTSGLADVQFADGSFVRAGVNASSWAVSLAGLYELSKTANLYANFARGYFFPQLRNFAPIASGVPGTDYRPETILQGELGLKFGTDKLSGSVAGYYVSLQDRISTINSFVNGELREVRRDELNTLTVGLEATIDYLLAKDLSLRASFTFQQHQITQNNRVNLIDGTSEEINVGNKLARQPNLLGFLGLYYDNNSFDGFATLNYTGEKFASDNNDILLDPIAIVRIGAGYTINLNENKESLRFGFNVFNLLNSQGVTEGNPRAVVQGEGAFFFGRPILPRRIFLTATLNF
ncbi:MAG: TonB-dependent receptor, partial [Bacteroidota bacterium]